MKERWTAAQYNALSIKLLWFAVLMQLLALGINVYRNYFKA